MSSVNEPSPCPFCGDEHFGIVHMTYHHRDGTKTKGKRVKCKTCGAQAPDTVWNQRSESAPLLARIAELEAKVEKSRRLTPVGNLLVSPHGIPKVELAKGLSLHYGTYKIYAVRPATDAAIRGNE